MKLLIVEDDLSYVNVFDERIRPIVGEHNLILARSRDSAFNAIKENLFDLAILDLQLPTVDDALDAEIEHGRAVYAAFRETLAGTPIIFLTAFATEDFITDLLTEAERDDIWGTGNPSPLIQMLSKSRLPELIEKIKSIEEIITTTDDLEVNLGVHGVDINEIEKRILRIFCRRNNGSSVAISSLSGGLSDTRVFRATIQDHANATRLIVAGKIGDINIIEDESNKYNSEVIRLPNGKYAASIGEIKTGAYGKGGIFYRLLEGYDQCLFDLLEDEPDTCADVIEQLNIIEQPWVEHQPGTQMTVGDIRRRLLGDQYTPLLEEYLGDLPWQDFEQREINVIWCTQHGDLHGGNILIGPDHLCTLIDYGEVGAGPAALDPITIELSLLWHPMAENLREWISQEAAYQWADIDSYVATCPFAAFIRACREWSFNAAAGGREVYASAYAYSVRQLKYENTDKDLAVAIATSAFNAFQQNT